jgi:hypothetical protein
MSENKNQRRPAFPEVCNNQIIPGMTLHEYYAGLAMQGLVADMISGMTGQNSIETEIKMIARFSVSIADALIKELEK